MRKFILLAAIACLAAGGAHAAKQHVVVLGKTMPVKLFIGTNEDKSIDLKVRPLMVDGKIKEFTTGESHDVTEQTFVIQRAYRVNDTLPEDPRSLPKWKWQRGVWLMVDRLNGHVTRLNLPEFDPYYSNVSWYREYAAYCGTSQNGEKLFAMVAQIGAKKAIVRHPLGNSSLGEMPDSECDKPQWQRQPTRVTFLPKHAQKVSFEIHSKNVDVNEGEADKDEE
jgi:hypothetical protein